MINYSELSEKQKECFKKISGYDYKQGKLKGSFSTDRPYDGDWDLSPWRFAYVFQIDTGFLFCELSHRMTNNRTFGWDYEGNEIAEEFIDKIFPNDIIG
jgi:hypothetical protein